MNVSSGWCSSGQYTGWSVGALWTRPGTILAEGACVGAAWLAPFNSHVGHHNDGIQLQAGLYIVNKQVEPDLYLVNLNEDEHKELEDRLPQGRSIYMSNSVAASVSVFSAGLLEPYGVLINWPSSLSFYR